MKTEKRIGVVALVCLVNLCVIPTTAEAASGHDFWRYYMLPVAAHTSGSQGTFWKTDVSIVNVYEWRSVRVYMKFLETNQDNSGAQEYSRNLGAGESVMLQDVVSSVFGETGNGAIEFYTKDGAYFIASARTYTGDDKTYGLSQLGQEYFGHGGGTTIVSGVRETIRFRASVGAVNASDRSISLEARAYDSNGNLKGSRVFALDPRSQTQIRLNKFASQFDSGYVVWRCLSSGSGIHWAGYATVTDNESGDGVFLPDRRNDQYVQYQPYYDQTGWWEGTVTLPIGGESGYLEVFQDGSEVVARIYRNDGRMSSILTGYEDQGTIVVTDVTVYDGQCTDTQLVDSNLTSESGAIHGNITISVSDTYECANGTMTLYFTPRASSPF